MKTSTRHDYTNETMVLLPLLTAVFAATAFGCWANNHPGLGMVFVSFTAISSGLIAWALRRRLVIAS